MTQRTSSSNLSVREYRPSKNGFILILQTRVATGHSLLTKGVNMNKELLYYNKDHKEIIVYFDYCDAGGYLELDGMPDYSEPVTKEEEKEILELIANDLDNEYYENQSYYENERMIARGEAMYDYWKENE